MDYEKEYKDALARMGLCVRTGLKITPEYIFPELAESEDERIRKEIISALKFANDGGVYDKHIAYLEKQKESTWTEEDESFRKHILPRILNPTSWTLEQIKADRELLKEFVERQKSKWTEKQKEQKPREIEWEDAETLAYIRDILKKHFLRSEEFEDINRWLTEHYIEQKPEERFAEARERYQVEWSEEEAHNLARFIEKRAKAYEFNLPNRGYDIFGFAKDILKYLRINQEKVEWSEEDINASVKSYSDSLPMCGEFQSYHDALVHAYRQGIVNALKSLKPQQKPVEWSRRSIIDALTKWLTEKITPLHKKSLDGPITEREEMFMAALLEMRSLVNSPDFQIGKDISVEWSEKDKFKLKEIIDLIGYSPISEDLKNEYISFLKSIRPQPMNTIKIDELEDFIDTELHKDEFIRRWPQYAFNVPEHKEGDEYSIGVAVGVGRVINKLRNFIVNKKA